MFETLDQSIINVCTRISHALQRTTGLTNFFVVKVGVFLYCIALLTTMINYWTPGLLAKPTPAWVVVLYFVILLTGAPFDIHQANESEDNIAYGRRVFTHRMMWSYPLRLLFVGFVLLDWGTMLIRHPRFPDFIDDLFSTGMAIVLYFSMVVPLPPGRSKVRQWIDSWTDVRMPVRVKE